MLNGTTIDEIADYHRDTPVLCAGEANGQYRDCLERKTRADREKAEREESQRRHVSEIASRITF